MFSTPTTASSTTTPTAMASPPRVVCHERRLNTTVRNCTRDEGGPFEAGSQVLASNHCKLLSPKAMVVSVAVNVGTRSRRGVVAEVKASQPAEKWRKRG